jgi:putative ABC transport system substrate-binding protein
MRLAQVGLTLALLIAPVIAGAQQAGKIARVGVLSAGAPPTAHEAYGEALRQLGYVERQNLLLEVRYADGRAERFPDLAAELVRAGVDVLVTSSQPGAIALKRATSNIPIVLFGVSDPVGAGPVQSLAQPGGNVTGVAWEVTPEEAGKRLQLLKEIVPTVSRVALVWRQQGATDAGYDAAWRAAAGALGVQLQLQRLRSSDDLEAAFAASRKKRAGAVIVWLWGASSADRRRAVELATRYRLPAMYGVRTYVDEGGLMSYGPNLPDIQRRAVSFVDRILKGARPSDLPVEQPTKYELVINLKVAKALSLTIPPSLLARADQIVE